MKEKDNSKMPISEYNEERPTKPLTHTSDIVIDITPASLVEQEIKFSTMQAISKLEAHILNWPLMKITVISSALAAIIFLVAILSLIAKTW